MVLNAAHIHLLINHAPIFGFAFGLFFLVWGYWRKSDDVIRAALVLFFLVGITSIAVFLSGDEAQSIVENLPGVSREAIEVHEEAGEAAMIAAVAMGLISGAVLVLFWKRAIPRWLTLAVGVGNLIAFGFLSYAGYRGGLIHHPEIRPQTMGVSSYSVPDLGIRLNLERSASSSS